MYRKVRNYSALTRVINHEAVAELSDIILKNPNYTIINALLEFGVIDSQPNTYPQAMLPCPFHEDASPSFSVEQQRNIFKCLSCGEGGGFFKFIMLYYEKVKGIKISYYALLESILQRDSVIKAELGLNTIYISKAVDTLNITIPKFKPNKDDGTDVTFRTVANAIRKDKAKTVDDKLKFVAMIQAGLSPLDIYADLLNVTFEQSTKSLEELLMQ